MIRNKSAPTSAKGWVGAANIVKLFEYHVFLYTDYALQDLFIRFLTYVRPLEGGNEHRDSPPLLHDFGAL